MLRVLQGKALITMTGAELRARLAGYAAVVLDIGTGDGRFVYREARAHPDQFYIGLDAVAENLAENAVKITRKAARGGAGNVLYVIENVETMPVALQGIANRICINYPWGSLFKGLILGDQGIVHNIAATAVPGASGEILINSAVFFDPVPHDILGLPELTDGYIENSLKPLYRCAGLTIIDYERIGKAVMKDIPTSWSKRLAYGKKPYTVRLRIKV
jgi:16S rRNA (adenine(1408)-N(1))-methyltransferase